MKVMFIEARRRLWVSYRYILDKESKHLYHRLVPKKQSKVYGRLFKGYSIKTLQSRSRVDKRYCFASCHSQEKSIEFIN